LGQQQEIEATTSQLYETAELIATLHDQGSVAATQIDGLCGRMHPICRLPVKLLLSVFEVAVAIAESRLGMEVMLSHACRSW
jgi:hypothetical protein